MKTLVLTEGGKDIGFGHLTRCIALSQAVKEIVPSSEIEFVINGNEAAQDFIITHGIESHDFDWHKKNKSIFNLLTEKDLVIIDSYLADKSIYDYISDILYDKLNHLHSGPSRLIMLDDYNRIEYPKGVVVNPSIFTDKLTYPQRDGITYLLGKEYIILRKEFWDVPEKVVNKQIKNILISLGGADYHEFNGNIIRDCLKSKFSSDLDITNAQGYKFNAGEMLDLMLKADLCISGGGQTVYELARIGVPTIGICFAENQKLNLEGLQFNGIMENIGWYNNADLLPNLSKSIDILSSYEERLRRSAMAKTLVDGNGARNIIQKVLMEAIN